MYKAGRGRAMVVRFSRFFQVQHIENDTTMYIHAYMSVYTDFFGKNY